MTYCIAVCVTNAGNLYRQFCAVSTCDSSDMSVDKQTNRQTRQSQYFAPVRGRNRHQHTTSSGFFHHFSHWSV